MKKQSMQAAVVHEFTSPLRLEEVAKPEPGPGEIVVKIEASGLCHTDIHAAHGSGFAENHGASGERVVIGRVSHANA